MRHLSAINFVRAIIISVTSLLSKKKKKQKYPRNDWKVYKIYNKNNSEKILLLLPLKLLTKFIRCFCRSMCLRMKPALKVNKKKKKSQRDAIIFKEKRKNKKSRSELKDKK